MDNDKKVNIEVSMAKMEKDISNIKEALARNDNCHQDIKDTFKENMKEIKELFSAIDKKYASKWVEKVALAMVGTILLTVLSAILGLVLIK